MPGETKVLSGHSPVNKYELLSLEQASQGITEDRMTLAFQAFDELLPKLGVYTRVLNKLRDDFFEAVYSDELTGVTGEEGAAEEAGFIQRLPYFILVQRVYKERHEQSEELRGQLDVVKERLFSKHLQLEESETRGDNLQATVEELEANIADLENTIADKNMEIKTLEQKLDTTKLAASRYEEHLLSDISVLENSLKESKEEGEFLSNYKTGYDDLYEAFQEKVDEDEEEEVQARRRAVISTRRVRCEGDDREANLLSQIESCSKLEQQLLSVLNTSLEEYDAFLEEHKAELESKVTTEDMTEAEYEIQEMEIDEADQQLETIQERFKVTIAKMNNEIGLLRQHNNMLVEQLQSLEENRPDPPKQREPKSGKSTSDLGNYRESILSAGLGDDDLEDAMTDPFIPQERVFSKYAAMIYTSNNSGKTFEEFKDAKYCPSCGEKTVVCPHRLGGSEKVYILPHDCTHLKITRPKVRINRNLVDTLMKQPSPEQDQLDSVATSTVPQTPGISRGGTGMADATMVNTMQAVWDDYRGRTSIERAVPRPLDRERTISLLEQFLAFLVWQDDYGEEEEGLYTVLENLYRFLTERYLVEEVVYLAAHDFLSSITEHAPSSKMLQLLGTVLSGNLDASTLRYVLVMCDFINAVEWKEVEDFRAFASVIYPFLGEDDLETLQMSYQSFSENKVSAPLVTNFIIHIILKYREPRFLELENRLLPFQGIEGGHLTEREFKDALESVLPLVNDRLRKRFFLEAESMYTEEEATYAVAIMRLAQISGYLGLHQITPIIRESIKTRVATWRDRPSSAGSTKPHTESPGSTVAEQPILSMTTVKNLASNVSRRTKHRQQRLLADNENEDW